MSDRQKTCTIPTKRVDEGLSYVASNVRHLCRDSRELMERDSPWHAVATAIFALEELAKYYDLKRKRDSALRSRTNVIKVDARLFGRGHANSHLYKLNIAKDASLIPEDAWQILAPDAIDARLFDYDVKDATVSAAMRTRNIFVDWVNEEWLIGSSYEPHRLKRLVDAIAEKLKQLVAEKA